MKLCSAPRKFVPTSRKGSATLVVVIVLAIVSSMIGISTAKISQLAMNSTTSNKVTMQANNFANSDAELIRSTDYSDLASTARSTISGTAFQHEISISNETDYSDTVKQKTATIKVYNGAETIPRSEIQLVRYSVEQKASGVPIGTVIAWFSINNPADGTWLECNGQSCAGYSELVSVLGKNTVPDLRGKFLEGDATPWKIMDAGLPNIEGSIVLRVGNFGGYPTSLFEYKYGGWKGYKGGEAGEYGTVNFNASRCSPIYGNSDTVQPPAVTVRYLIKAA